MLRFYTMTIIEYLSLLALCALLSVRVGKDISGPTRAEADNGVTGIQRPAIEPSPIHRIIVSNRISISMTKNE